MGELMALALTDRMFDLAKQRGMEAPPADDIYARAADYVGYHQAHKERIRKLDAILNGNWQTVFPDGSVTSDMPKVADFISSDLEDLSALVAGPEPSTICPPANDTEREMRASLTRQHIIATYRRENQYHLVRRRLALDLIGTGLCCLVIWPNYDADDMTRAYPMYQRKDPRHVFPDPNLSNPTEVSSLVVAYRTKARVLAATFPHIRNALFTQHERDRFDTSDVEVVEYYDEEWCIKVAGYRASGERRPRTALIAQARNLVGCPLALIQARPTPDGKFRGQFDKAIAPLGTANKIMELHLMQLADEIFSEKIVRGVFDNPQDVGPGATLYTTDPSANIERATPAGSHPQMYNDVQLLLSQSRESAGVPAARHGDIDQNIASAQFVNAIQGKYITAVNSYQFLLADLEERANTLAFKVDEVYMGWPKQLTGIVGGRSTAEDYDPLTDIAGRYDNRVVYGAGSGLDSYNRRLAIIQDIQYGLASRRTGRSQLDYVSDVLAEEAEIARERMEDGFLAMMADPNGLPPEQRLRALALASEGHSVFEIATILDEEARAAAAQQQQLAAAMAPAEMAETSGQAPGQALPSLATLRGGY